MYKYKNRQLKYILIKENDAKEKKNYNLYKNIFFNSMKTF